MSAPDSSKRAEIRQYVIGYALALAFTAAAFAAVRWPIASGGVTFAIVLALGLIQLVAQFRYFLHITLGKHSRDDLLLILFTVLIIGLMVSGTLIILFNLRERMM